MTCVCDSCQPTVDGYVDLWKTAGRDRDEAQHLAWKATDLLTRWMELFIERDNMPDAAYIAALAQLLSESQGHILTAPAYTLASSNLNVVVPAGAAGHPAFHRGNGGDDDLGGDAA